MKSWQKQIYFIAGESVEQVEDSPFLEALKAKDLEVLYMVDPIDEYAVQNLPEFDGHRLQSITKENLKFGDEEDVDKKRQAMYEAKLEGLVDKLSKLYGDKVEKVSVSNRVQAAPAIIVTSQYGYSANMERIMRSQAFADPSRAKFLSSKKTIEINPRHPIVSALATRAEGSDELDEETRNLANVLYDTALLNSGFQMTDTKEFASRMYRLMQTGMNLESLSLEAELEVPEDALVEEEEVEEEEEEEEEEEMAASHSEEL